MPLGFTCPPHRASAAQAGSITLRQVRGVLKARYTSGSDCEDLLGEGGRHPPTRRLLDRQLIVASPEVLDEAVSGDNHPALRSCLRPRIARSRALRRPTDRTRGYLLKESTEIAGDHGQPLTRSAADAAASWRRPGVSDSTGPVQPQIANRRLGEGQPLLGSVAIPGRQPANGGQPVQPEPDRVDRPPALGERAAENGLAAVAAQVAMPHLVWGGRRPLPARLRASLRADDREEGQQTRIRRWRMGTAGRSRQLCGPCC